MSGGRFWRRLTTDEFAVRFGAQHQPHPVHTITRDTGTEFHGYAALEVATQAAFYGDLDHAVQRDVFDDFELSQLSLSVLGLSVSPCVWP